MSKLLDKTWWAETAERAVKTFAQVAVGFIAVDGLGFADVDWNSLLSVAGVAAVASVLMRVSMAGEGKETVVVNKTTVVETSVETPEQVAEKILNTEGK